MTEPRLRIRIAHLSGAAASADFGGEPPERVCGGYRRAVRSGPYPVAADAPSAPSRPPIACGEPIRSSRIRDSLDSRSSTS